MVGRRVEMEEGTLRSHRRLQKGGQEEVGTEREELFSQVWEDVVGVHVCVCVCVLCGVFSTFIYLVASGLSCGVWASL